MHVVFNIDGVHLISNSTIAGFFVVVVRNNLRSDIINLHASLL